jgi:hypothetical protein
MAESDSVDFKSGPFGLSLKGDNALVILLFLSIVALAALTFWEHKARSDENAAMQCMIKLNLFVNQLPRGEPLDWSKVPVDLYGCVPRFLYERPSK